VDSQCSWCWVGWMWACQQNKFHDTIGIANKRIEKSIGFTAKQSKIRQKTIKTKLDELNKKLAKEMNGRRFKLEPEQFSPEVTVKHYHASSKKIFFRCKMMQIPANSNDATTGHKLQGMSKDAIIVSSWPTGSFAAMFKNWEYVVLSWVRATKGVRAYPYILNKYVWVCKCVHLNGLITCLHGLIT